MNDTYEAITSEIFFNIERKSKPEIRTHHIFNPETGEGMGITEENYAISITRAIRETTKPKKNTRQKYLISKQMMNTPYV